jgi:hypothetical protein
VKKFRKKEKPRKDRFQNHVQKKEAKKVMKVKHRLLDLEQREKVRRRTRRQLRGQEQLKRLPNLLIRTKLIMITMKHTQRKKRPQNH